MTSNDFTHKKRLDPRIDAGSTINLGYNYNEVFQAFQGIEQGQKYHNWNGSTNDVRNHHNQFVDGTDVRYTANLYPTVGNISIRNELVDTPLLNFGSVQFHDPWFIDYADPDFGNNYRNRGMQDILFYTRSTSSGPFTPDLNTSFPEGIYQGIFLGQDPQNTPSYYSLKLPSSTTFNIGGASYNTYFKGWTGTNVDFQYPDASQTPVVFNASGAQAKAIYKAQLAIGDPIGYKNSGQRKVVRTPDGYAHMVYASAGKIWYEIGDQESAGITWYLMNGSQPINGSTEAKSPSISYSNNKIVITYQEKIGSNNYKIVLQIFEPPYEYSIAKHYLTSELAGLYWPQFQVSSILA